MHSGDRFPAVLAGLITSILILLAGCATGPVTPSPASRTAWVESSLASMPLRDRVAQMIMVRAYGYYYSDGSDEFRRLKHLVSDLHVGGMCMFQGDVDETATVCNRLQSLSAMPLLVACDAEWGTAMRIRRATRLPEAMAAGATGDTALVRAAGGVTGSELRAIGIHVDFAPDADVNVNPDNPVINTRSFGEDPAMVAMYASAFAAGLQSAGVVATAKHFPGHGDTDVDSHLDLPIVHHTRQRLDSIELVPFRRLIAGGVGSVMIAHLEVPSLQGSEQAPATLSKAVVTDFLKSELGYRGLIVTDAMDMGAIVNRYGADSSAVRAVQAGVDIVLIPADEEKAIDAITGAVMSGTISRERIDGSVRKILGMKWDAGLAVRRTVDIASAHSVVASPEHLAVARQLARESITLLRGDSMLPLTGRNGTTLVLIATDAENYRTEINRSTVYYPNEQAGDYFAAQVRKRTPLVQVARIDPSSDSLEMKHVLRQAKSAGTIICAVYCRARSGSGSLGLPPEMLSLIDTLTKLHTRAVVVALGTPYILGAFPAAKAAMCVYSDAELPVEAAVEALYGEIPVTGRLPVTIPGVFRRGDGITMRQSVLRRDRPETVGMTRDSLAAIDSVMTAGIRSSSFPGGQVVVLHRGAVVYNRAFGTLEYDAGSPAVQQSTIYDCASLTKVIATTNCIMRLYDEGKFRLDDPVVRYIPEFGFNGKSGITIRNLLLHNGGLPAFKRLWLTCSTPAQALDSVYRTEMLYRPGDSTVYSDFDFIVLGKLVETVSGASLDRYFDSVFARPLGCSRTMFNPPASYRQQIAPTEFDSLYRHQLVRGVVHDENAYVLGGVSGHAGLFSTASDLAVVMQMLMNGGSYGGIRYIRPETIELFTRRQGTASTRGLGWDTKTMNGYSTAGTLFGPRSFGHTGFTGTSVWVDPDRDLAVIVCTNRVNPTRANGGISRVRPALHDAVVRSLAPESR